MSDHDRGEPDDEAATGFLVVRVWIEPGGTPALRARVRGSRGESRVVTGRDGVLDAVSDFLDTIETRRSERTGD